MGPGEMEQCWVRSHIFVPPGVHLGAKQDHLCGSLEPVHSESGLNVRTGEKGWVTGRENQCPHLCVIYVCACVVLLMPACADKGFGQPPWVTVVCFVKCGPSGAGAGGEHFRRQLP